MRPGKTCFLLHYFSYFIYCPINSKTIVFLSASKDLSCSFCQSFFHDFHLIKNFKHLTLAYEHSDTYEHSDAYERFDEYYKNFESDIILMCMSRKLDYDTCI